jgi:hypothetical protein
VAEYRGLPVAPYWFLGRLLKGLLVKNVAVESTAHTRRLITVVVAEMERKRIRQTGKRSCGRRPTVYAKDDSPFVASSGSVNKVFGTLESMNIGEF